MEVKFIAFIDLIGVSEMAEYDPGAYNESLELLQRAVENECDQILNLGGQIYFFSDCLYIESEDLEALIKFIKQIRFDLFVRGYYLKGAISYGLLEPNEIRKIGQETGGIIKGYYFSRDTLNVYSPQEKLKGIGISVNCKEKHLDAYISKVIKEQGISPEAMFSDEFIEIKKGLLKTVKEVEKKYLVKSCFLKHTNSKRVVTYWDIGFSANRIEHSVLETLIKRMIESYTQSKRITRYYLSLLINLIMSTNFENEKKLSDNIVKIIEKTDERGDRITELKAEIKKAEKGKDLSRIKNELDELVKQEQLVRYNSSIRRELTEKANSIFRIVYSGILDNHFSDVYGFNYLYYALLNMLDKYDEKYLKKYLQDRMFSKKKILKYLETVPRCVFSYKLRREFLENLSQDKVISK